MNYQATTQLCKDQERDGNHGQSGQRGNYGPKTPATGLGNAAAARGAPDERRGDKHSKHCKSECCGSRRREDDVGGAVTADVCDVPQGQQQKNGRRSEDEEACGCENPSPADQIARLASSFHSSLVLKRTGEQQAGKAGRLDVRVDH